MLCGHECLWRLGSFVVEMGSRWDVRPKHIRSLLQGGKEADTGGTVGRLGGIGVLAAGPF